MNDPMDHLLDSLPLAKRLAHYRQLAEDALSEVDTAADQNARGGLLSMAAGWHMLASELERSMLPSRSDINPG